MYTEIKLYTTLPRFMGYYSYEPRLLIIYDQPHLSIMNLDSQFNRFIVEELDPFQYQGLKARELGVQHAPDVSPKISVITSEELATKKERMVSAEIIPAIKASKVATAVISVNQEKNRNVVSEARADEKEGEKKQESIAEVEKKAVKLKKT